MVVLIINLDHTNTADFKQMGFYSMIFDGCNAYCTVLNDKVEESARTLTSKTSFEQAYISYEGA